MRKANASQVNNNRHCENTEKKCEFLALFIIAAQKCVLLLFSYIKNCARKMRGNKINCKYANRRKGSMKHSLCTLLRLFLMRKMRKCAQVENDSSTLFRDGCA